MILDEIATYLAAQSTDFTALSGSGGNLTKAFMPDAAPAPDTIATIYETGGVAPVHTFSTGDLPDRAFENPRVQMITRSTSYTTARNLADTAFKLLDGLNSQSLPTSTGTRYIDITAVQSPFSIGRDANGRYLISVNFDVRKLVTGITGDPGGFDSGFSGGFA
jgi:hypothetical protein